MLPFSRDTFSFNDYARDSIDPGIERGIGMGPKISNRRGA